MPWCRHGHDGARRGCQGDWRHLPRCRKRTPGPCPQPPQSPRRRLDDSLGLVHALHDTLADGVGLFQIQVVAALRGFTKALTPSFAIFSAVSAASARRSAPYLKRSSVLPAAYSAPLAAASRASPMASPSGRAPFGRPLRTQAPNLRQPER